MIEKFINEIRKDVSYDYTNDRKIITWTFIGDGMGDFEKHKGSATKRTVKNYIEYCKNQIKLAEEYLKE